MYIVEVTNHLKLEIQDDAKPESLQCSHPFRPSGISRDGTGRHRLFAVNCFITSHTRYVIPVPLIVPSRIG
jgi:hypothetical protein